MAARVLGIDLLRIAAMFMVVTLHVLGPGAVFESIPRNTASWYLGMLFLAENTCAVDMFMMASGWLLVTKRPNFARLLELGLQTYFVSFVMRAGASAYAAAHGGGGGGVVSWSWFFSDFWYWNAYVSVFLLSPFLNEGLRTAAADKNGTRRTWFLLAATAIAVSCLPLKVEGEESGYSVAWMVVCYLFGGWIRLSVPQIRRKRDLFCIETGALALPAVQLAVWQALRMAGFGVPRCLQSYQSPFVLCCAACHLAFFANLPLKRLPGLLKWASTVSFGVYLFHMQGIARQILFGGRFAWIGKTRFPALVPLSWCAALCVYAICGLLDSARARLFDLIGVRKICNRFFPKPGRTA